MDMEVTNIKKEPVEIQLQNVEVDFNPWKVKDASVFLKYCCPECDFQSLELNRFSSHALENHLKSSTLFEEAFDPISDENPQSDLIKSKRARKQALEPRTIKSQLVIQQGQNCIVQWSSDLLSNQKFKGLDLLWSWMKFHVMGLF